MVSPTSPGNLNGEKYIYNRPNTPEDSRYSLLYPPEQRHFSMDTTEYSRYSTNHPYTKKHTLASLNAEQYLPHSSNYSKTRRYNEVDSKVNLSHSSRYSGTEMNRHTFASDHNERVRIESLSSRHLHNERYTPTEVNETNSSDVYDLGRNKYARLETFDDSVILSQKYAPANLNTADNLEYLPFYPRREQYVPIDKNYTHSSRNLYSKTKMNTEADDVRDSLYPTYYKEKKNLTRMKVVEDSAFFPLNHYTRKNSAFVSHPHGDKTIPTKLDDSSIYHHTELNPLNLDNEFLHNPQSGRYMSIDQGASITSERNTPTEVNERNSSDFYDSGRNKYSRLETFDNSVILSQKYAPTNANTADNLDYLLFNPRREQYVPTDRNYTYSSRNLHLKTKMNTDAEDVRDPLYSTYIEKKNLTGMEVVEASAFSPFQRYTRENTAFDSHPHRYKTIPTKLDDSSIYLHAELNHSNLDDQFLHNPRSGRYISIDQGASITSTNTRANLGHGNNSHTSQPIKRKRRIDKAAHKASPTPSKKKYCCKLCKKKFRHRYPLHMHMVDTHNVNGGKYIPPIKREKPKIASKELMQMKVDAKSSGPDFSISKKKKCEFCYKTVRAMHRHMRGAHNPKFKFKCNVCRKTFKKENLLNLHKTGRSTDKCLPKAVRAKLDLSKRHEEPASSASYSTNFHENQSIELDVAKESRDLAHPYKQKHIPTEVRAVEYPLYPTCSQTKGEILSELGNISTKETETAAAEHTTGLSQSIHTGMYVPIEIDAVTNPYPTSYSQTIGEIPTELWKPEDPTDISTAENSSGLVQSSHTGRYIPIELDAVTNQYPSGYSQTIGEIPTELWKSGDPTDMHKAENSSGPSQSSHTGRYIPIELDAVIASSSTSRELHNIVSRPILVPLKCEHCNEKFYKKSYLTHHNKVKHGIYRPQFKISCHFCIKKFKKAVDLQQHCAHRHGTVPSVRRKNLKTKKIL